jgi:hypothetical protein
MKCASCISKADIHCSECLEHYCKACWDEHVSRWIVFEGRRLPCCGVELVDMDWEKLDNLKEDGV